MSKTSHQKHERKQLAVSNPQNDTEPADYQVHTFGDILIVLLIIGLGIIFILPYYGLMPAAGRLALLVIFAITIALFAGSLWRQKPAKMAITHPQTAGHLAYLAAVVTLACVIILQLISGQLDIWLIIVLVVIVIVRSLLVISHKP